MSEIIPKEITPIQRIPKEEIVGRTEELELIRNILTLEQKPVLLKGINGIGKTTLATVYATENYESYGHIVWLSNSDSFDEAILKNTPLLTKLGVSHQHPGQRVRECLDKLSALKSDKPNLFIIDDADINLSVYYDRLPTSPSWHLLVNSKERLSPFHLIELGALNEKRAVELFHSHCKELSDDQVQPLVCALQLHPLLIEVLAKLYGSNHIQYEVVYNALITHSDKSSSSSVVYELKEEDRIRDLMIGLFNLIAAGENETWLLKQFLVLPEDWVELEMLQHLLHVEKLDWLQALPEMLTRLATSGYLQKDPKRSGYKMHSMIRKALIRKLNITTQDVFPLIERVTSLLNDTMRPEKFPNQLQFISFGEAILKVFPSCRLREISFLQKKLARVFHDLGESERARDLLEPALEADLELYGEKHPEIAIHRSHLALICKDLGDFEEARDLFESALQSDIENFGENHPRVASHHSNLAHVYQDLGDYEKARNLLEQTLSIELGMYEPTHPFISQAQSNLATIYKHLGEFEKARDYLETSLCSDLLNFGENHPSISVTRANLASIYRSLGDNERARDLMEAALSADLVNLGEKHPSVAVNQSILANIYAGLGDFEKSRHLWEKVLHANTENFGENHPNVALCQSNLAGVYSDLGNFEKARDLLEEALKSDLINFGEKHPYVALSQSNLANTYYSLGEYEAARDLFEKNLKLHKVLYEPDHPFIAQVQSNLANLYSDLGDFDNARKMLEIIMESDLRKFGSDHPKFAAHQSNLANLYADFGDTEKARELWASAYQILKNTVGADHPNTLSVKGFLEEAGKE